MTPGAWIPVLERGHISYHIEILLSSTLSIYCAFIAIVVRDCDPAFLYHRRFLFSDGAVDIIYKYEPF